MPRLRQLAFWSLRVFIGALFLFSAVAKLTAIDDFELYIYSYGFFPLNFCFFLARICIGAEFFLAVLTLFGWCPRLARVASLATLLFFSLFLCYAILNGRDESCRCFGRWLDLNPGWSLLKNALLIPLILLYYRMVTGGGRRWTKVAAVVAALASFTAPFVVSIPDNWLFGPAEEPYNDVALRESLSPEGSLRALGVGEGHQLVAFLTQRCPYCQLARRKIDSMAKRHSYAEGSVRYVYPADISDRIFLDITCVDGICSRPLILLLAADSVVATYHLRNIDERQVTEFLTF